MKLSESEIKAIISECLHNLESLGPEFKLRDDVKINLNLFDATGTFGQCAIGFDNARQQFMQEISFNKHLMIDSIKDSIINTVYHEFCHYYQNREAIEAGFYYVNEEGRAQQSDNPQLKEYFEGDDAGHSKCWFKYVDIVNARLKPNIPVTAHPNEADYNDYIAANEEDVLFTIYCTSCDNKLKFLSYSQHDWQSLPLGFLTEIIKRQEHDETNNFCKCGGCLKIAVKDESVLYNILESERSRFIMEMLGGMFHGR